MFDTYRLELYRDYDLISQVTYSVSSYVSYFKDSADMPELADLSKAILVYGGAAWGYTYELSLNTPQTYVPYDYPMAKYIYLPGEELDLTNILLAIVRRDDTSFCIEVTPNMISGFDNTELGEQEIVVSAFGSQVTYNVTVVDSVSEIKVISEPSSSTHYVGNPLMVYGGTILVTYSDDSKQIIPMTDDMISGFDSSTAGVKEVTVTYHGATATFEVTVSENPFIVIG